MSSLNRFVLNATRFPAVLQKLTPSTFTVIPHANAGSGVKGNTKLKVRTAKNRRRGLRVEDGDRVHEGFCLARQIHSFRWRPGANVSCDHDKMLTAMCTGNIKITKEIHIPAPGTAEAEIVKDFPKGSLMYCTYISVIPDPIVGKFKLVSAT